MKNCKNVNTKLVSGMQIETISSRTAKTGYFKRFPQICESKRKYVSN